MCLLFYRGMYSYPYFLNWLNWNCATTVALILLYTPAHTSSVTVFYIRKVSHVLQCHASKAHGTSSFGHIFISSDLREGKVGDIAGLGVLTGNWAWLPRKFISQCTPQELSEIFGTGEHWMKYSWQLNLTIKFMVQSGLMLKSFLTKKSQY